MDLWFCLLNFLRFWFSVFLFSIGYVAYLNSIKSGPRKRQQPVHKPPAAHRLFGTEHTSPNEMFIPGFHNMRISPDNH